MAIIVSSTMAGQRRLTLSEAERLVRAAMSEEGKLPPAFDLEPPPITPKQGATFHILWSGSTSDNVAIKSIVVDIDTAEVWDAARCKRLSTPALKAIQSIMRRELKAAATAVSRARAEAEMHDCSNLIDPRPKRSDFHSAQVISADTGKSGGRGIQSDPVAVRIRYSRQFHSTHRTARCKLQFSLDRCTPSTTWGAFEKCLSSVVSASDQLSHFQKPSASGTVAGIVSGIPVYQPEGPVAKI